MIRTSIRNFIISREGVEYKVYRDSLGKLTGGIGHLVLPEDKLKEGDEISQELVDTWFEKDIQKSKTKAIAQCEELGITDFDIINIFISANYQLGDFKKVFNETYLLIKAKKYAQAILNIATSKWMKQTPIRAGDMISAITKLV